jgi:hypothetical protein
LAGEFRRSLAETRRDPARVLLLRRVYLRTNLTSILCYCEIVVPIYHVVACRADSRVRNLVVHLTACLNLVSRAALLIVGHLL